MGLSLNYLLPITFGLWYLSVGLARNQVGVEVILLLVGLAPWKNNNRDPRYHSVISNPYTVRSTLGYSEDFLGDYWTLLFSETVGYTFDKKYFQLAQNKVIFRGYLSWVVCISVRRVPRKHTVREWYPIRLLDVQPC